MTVEVSKAVPAVQLGGGSSLKGGDILTESLSLTVTVTAVAGEWSAATFGV